MCTNLYYVCTNIVFLDKKGPRTTLNHPWPCLVILLDLFCPWITTCCVAIIASDTPMNKCDILSRDW